MSQKEILEFCLEKGFLLDRDVLNLFSDIGDMESVKLIIEKVKNKTHQKIITKKIFFENKSVVEQFFLNLPKESQKCLEKLKIKLGLSIEISSEREVYSSVRNKEKIDQELQKSEVKVFSKYPCFNGKIEVKSFVQNFRNRFFEIKNKLQAYPELTNLISIDKIFGERKGISLIGMVIDKKVTKNKNILLDIEDLTGKIRVLVNQNKPEIYKKAEDISLDSVIGFSGSGNRNIIFVDNIIFPESMIFERKRSFVDESVLFLGDLHFGSKLFLEKNFLKFIDYVNGKVPNTPEVNNIKYIFIVGDLVTGVGNYPSQEKYLKILDLEEQFLAVADLFKKIRKDIKIIISPGNHDGVRLMEPQPCLDKKYAWPLYKLDNVFLTGNPARVNIGAQKNFSGFDVLTYHGFSFFYYARNVQSLMKEKAINSPEKIMKYLLKNSHLAPSYTSVQYFPFEKDALIIKESPDIFVSAHAHKSEVSYYNNILVVSTSCWEKMTPYQKKFGNKPDYCKVPMFNLKTREVKILDFEEVEDENRD